MRMRSLAALAVFLAAFAASVAAQNFQPFVIRDIRVEGLQRTEPGTVFSYLPVKVGDTMTAEKAQQSLRALFATGFFRDVRLDVEKDVLIVIVDERPAIAQIDFAGVKEFDRDKLRGVLRDQGMAEGRIFDRSVLETAEQEMKRQYLSRGLYAAEVQTTVTPLERNRVGVTFSVTEGGVAKIRSINIIGARAFKEKELVDLFVLRTPGWLTWYTKLDQYSRQKLSADLETLRSFYLNRGYLDFNIESTQVSITPDKRDIYITVNVTEGEKYTVSDVRLAGQLLVPEADLRKLIKIKPGDVFSREKLTESTKAINERLGNDGYAFANANAVPQVDKDKRTVSFSILIDPGRRVYVRRINVAGNSKTRDEVVRREMRQLEGAFYDASKIQLSKKRVDRTTYFKDVNVETVPVPGSQDQVDVNFTVEEKPTGAIMLGAGISNVDRVIVSGSISQANIFGSGKYVSAQMNTGRVNTAVSLSYTNPYYTVDGVSQGFDVYGKNTDLSSLDVGAYKTRAFGGGMRFAYPISERDAISFGLNLENTRLETFDSSPLTYINFVNQFGSTYTYGTGAVGWARDTRDSAIMPVEGTFARAGLEVAEGNLKFYRVTYTQNLYFPLTRNLTLSLTGDVGAAHGIDGKPLPFFKNFYGGGPGSVRGYRAYSLGPLDANANALGGNRKVVGSAELLFPVPGAEKDKSLRLGWFFDAGQIYGDGERLAPSDLRYSTGLSFAWNSPFGPLRVSLAFPLHARDGIDHTQRLQFNFGTNF